MKHFCPCAFTEKLGGEVHFRRLENKCGGGHDLLPVGLGDRLGVPGIPGIILKIRKRIYLKVCRMRTRKDHEAMLAKPLPWE